MKTRIVVTHANSGTLERWKNALERITGLEVVPCDSTAPTPATTASTVA